MINSTTVAFWLIGILNNMPFVIMLAGAKGISEGGTGLVFIANTMPGLLCKISSPYWFDKVTYVTRIKIGTILMSLSFCVVSFFSHLNDKNASGGGINFNVSMQLLGVALGSAHGSLGEASLLALCGRADVSLQNQHRISQHEGNTYVATNQFDEMRDESQEDKPICISAFSSGTGLAGVLGFGFVYICTNLFNLSLSGTLVVALILPFMYWKLFDIHLKQYVFDDISSEIPTSEDNTQSLVQRAHAAAVEYPAGDTVSEDHEDFIDNPSCVPSSTLSIAQSEGDDESTISTGIGSSGINSAQTTNQMTNMERFYLVLSLWPYMVPLFIVYAAEYALQSGVWTAIGYPNNDEQHRKSFYVASSWMVRKEFAHNVSCTIILNLLASHPSYCLVSSRSFYI
jgi:CLN3 protein.